MADRGRDLKIAILSDASKFDLSEPASDLDHLGSKAKTAGRDVQKMGSDVKGTGRDLDSLGSDAKSAQTKVDALGTKAKASGKQLDAMGKDAKGAGKDLDLLAADAKSTASKVDASFDAIAKASKTKIADPMTREAHRAGEATAEFKDEAKQNLSEVASSFQGDMTSAVDLVQGTLGGLASSLGPVGAAIGALGAVGIGALAQKFQASQQAAKDLVTALIEGGGKLGQQKVFDKIAEFAEGGALKKIRADADRLGISYSDLAAAYGGDADALDKVLPKVDALKQAMQDNAGAVDSAGSANDDYAAAIFQVSSDLTDQAGKNRDASDAVSGYTQATKDAASAAAAQQKAEEAKAAALQETASLVDSAGSALDAYNQVAQTNTEKEQARAQAVADGTKDSKDKWDDYAKAVPASIQQVNDALQKQVDATANWSDNLKTLARKGVEEGVLAELARMGPEGAPLVAKLAKATGPELDKYVSLSKAKAKQGTDGFIASLLDGIPGVADAGARQKAALIKAVGGDIPVSVKFKGDAVEFYRTLDDVRRAASTGVNVQVKYAAMDRAIP